MTTSIKTKNPKKQEDGKGNNDLGRENASPKPKSNNEDEKKKNKIEGVKEKIALAQQR